MTNQAERGEGSVHFLHKPIDAVLPLDLDVDLVIVDFGVDDAVIEDFDFDLDYVKMAHEALVRHVRNDMFQSPALFYVESFIAPRRVRSAPHQASNKADVHAEVARLYDIPMVRRVLRVPSLFWLLKIHRPCDGIVAYMAKRV